jgi:hypothetical protein
VPTKVRAPVSLLRHDKPQRQSQLVVGVSDKLPFDGHECTLICRDLNSSELRRAIGCRLHGNWKIEDCALVKCVVLAWLKLPSTPSNI